MYINHFMLPNQMRLVLLAQIAQIRLFKVVRDEVIGLVLQYWKVVTRFPGGTRGKELACQCR